MGQAKLRGSREDRIAQAKTAMVPPKPGRYVSAVGVLGMSFVVEDVSVSDEDQDFFLVSMIDEASAADPSAVGDELSPDQWFDLVKRYGLVLTGPA